MRKLTFVIFIYSILQQCNLLAQQRELYLSDSTVDIPPENIIVHVQLEQQPIKSPLRLTDKIFKNIADFSHAWFSKQVNFDKLRFTSLALFDSCQFSATTNFHHINFEEEVYCKDSKFDTIYIIDMHFKGRCIFDGSSFKRLVCDSADFASTSFNNSAFTANALFYRTKFHQRIDFSSSSVEHYLVFQSCKFDSTLNLSEIYFSDSCHVSFNRCQLPDTINFSKNEELPHEVDFTTANFENLQGKRKIKVFLFKSDITNIRIDYEHFQLIFEDPVTHEALSSDERTSLYESLLNNFKSRGQTYSYRNLDIEYQRFKWQTSRASWFAWFPCAWWNYGYDKELIFVWAAGLIIVFTLINYFFVKFLNEQVYKLNNIPVLKKNELSLRGGLEKLWYSFVYTSNIFLRLTLKIDSIKYRHVWGTLYLMLMYLSGILCVAYIANFIIQK